MDSLLAYKATDLASVMFKETNKTKIQRSHYMTNLG